MPLMANVVYQFACLRDANSTYIGKTIRHLATKVREHTTSPSAIKEHLSSMIHAQPVKTTTRVIVSK